MTIKLKSRHGCTALIAAALSFPLSDRPAAAGEVAAVLSSGSGPYSEAYAAFKKTMTQPFETYDLSKPGTEIPENTLYVAAFGAKAAALDYAPDTHLVYALAPVAGLGGMRHEVAMVPAPAAALAAYKALQPGLRRLAVFWAAYPGEKYITDLRRAGKDAGIEIIPSRLKSGTAFPERLRALMPRMDAFWLMPDPALITQSSIMVLASFSCDNAIPFYAPTSALVASGATAAYAPEFAEAGAAAARAIMVMHDGGRLPQESYVEKVSLLVNTDLPKKCRWPIIAK